MENDDAFLRHFAAATFVSISAFGLVPVFAADGASTWS
jgi:hypothetical protein